MSDDKLVIRVMTQEGSNQHVGLQAFSLEELLHLSPQERKDVLTNHFQQLAKRALAEVGLYIE